MMRSLYTAASGMKTQQATVDSISNNLSNVNTNGFKKERLEFKSLIYETIKEAGDTNKGANPVNMQIGHGVRTVASVKAFDQGTFIRTENPLDIFIEGDGLFVVREKNGEERFTRDGAMKVSLKDSKIMLTTSTGLSYLNTKGEPITFEGINPENLVADTDGKFTIMKDGKPFDLNQQIQIVQFKNPQGLMSMGGSLFKETVASGDKMLESDNDNLTRSNILQGGLEGSNVQAVEEMVKLIVAQRAYELSSKTIQASDEMLSLANQLKR